MRAVSISNSWRLQAHRAQTSMICCRWLAPTSSERKSKYSAVGKHVRSVMSLPLWSNYRSSTRSNLPCSFPQVSQSILMGEFLPRRMLDPFGFKYRRRLLMDHLMFNQADPERTVTPPSQPTHPERTKTPSSQPAHPETTAIPPSQPAHPETTVTPPSQPTHPERTVTPPSQPAHPGITITPASQPADSETTVTRPSQLADPETTATPPTHPETTVV